MKLSLRLKSIANLVDSNDVVADIGCDHAYLDIYLVMNNIVPKTPWFTAVIRQVPKNLKEMGFDELTKLFNKN